MPKAQSAARMKSPRFRENCFSTITGSVSVVRAALWWAGSRVPAPVPAAPAVCQAVRESSTAHPCALPPPGSRCLLNESLLAAGCRASFRLDALNSAVGLAESCFVTLTREPTFDSSLQRRTNVHRGVREPRRLVTRRSKAEVSGSA